ncbi:hypothetical protein LUW77_00380 [Streptomyces radiopugnans]|nr:hypothetical protein LUW77_00380 [Streptomyces radiopugnans]
MRGLHHEADPHDGVLGALAQLLTRAAQTIALTPTWPASQVLSLDALRGAVSDDFSVKLTVLSTG